MPQTPNRKRLWHIPPSKSKWILWKWILTFQTGIALLFLVMLASEDPVLVHRTWWYRILLLSLAISILWNWKSFFYLQTGITLLVLVAVASIFGTLIDPLEKAQALVYHTSWYQILLLSLALSIVCTTVRTVVEKTIPSFRIRFRDPHESRAPGRPFLTVPFTGNVEAVAAVFKSRRFRVATEGALGYAWKGRITRLGSPIAHFGVVVVLLGGFLAAWVSREGVVDLAEGEETGEMGQGSAPGHAIPLGFTLRCDDFETGFFPKTRIPSKYVSSLTVLGSQNTIQTGKVEVNRSLVTGGWKIHQSSFMEIPGANRFLVEIGRQGVPTSVTLELSPGQTRALPGVPRTEISLGGDFPYPWTLTADDGRKAQGVLFRNGKGLRLRLDRFVADFVMGADHKVASRSDELNNPAAHIIVFEGDQEVLSQWLFAREDLKGMMHSQNASGYEFDLAKVSREGTELRFDLTARDTKAGRALGPFRMGLGEETVIPAGQPDVADSNQQDKAGADWRVVLVKRVPAYRTILTLTRNPALPIIYAGCGIVMAGLLLVFLVGCKEIRFRADERKSLLHVVGMYRHPREGFDRTTAQILEKLRHSEGTVEAMMEPSAVAEAGGLNPRGERQST